MNSQRILDNFLKLVQIDSPSRQEKDMAAELVSQLEALGMEVYVDGTAEETGSNTGNVIATLQGTGPGKLVLSSHMDTVDPCVGIEPVVGEDGVIRSAGNTILGSDDKSGVASIIEAVTSLTEQTEKPYPTILITFTVQEEVGLCGAKALDPALFEGNPLALVVDGDEAPGGICIGAPFHYTFTATFTGKPAHAGVAPEKGISAIGMAARAIAAFDYGRIDEETTANIGTIHGGTAGNVVAAECKVLGECRSLNMEKLRKTRVIIEENFERAALEAGGKLEMEWDLEYHGYRLSEDDPVLVMLKDAARDAGLDPFTDVSGGGSDANVLAGKGANPVVLGTGMTNFHTTDECIKVADLENIARFIEAIAYRVAQNA